jgi:hypothetical protein
MADGTVIVAVADGLGSAPRSDLGATTATEAAVARVCELVGTDPSDAATEGLVAARDALEKQAVTEGCELADLACTLIVAVASERIGIAHIGDGAVIGMHDGDPYVLAPPGPSEYLNEVDALTADDWDGHIRTVVCLDGIDAFAAFTDGCQHAALRRDGGRTNAHAAFFTPLFGFARSDVSDQDAVAALEGLLGGAKVSEHSDDDKTLVLVALSTSSAPA